MSEYTPITGELRERIGQAEHIIPLSGDSNDTQVRINLAWLKEKLDAIDSIHAQLERENADLRMKFVNVNRHARHVERENESLKAELDRVLGEQEEHQHSISEVTVTVMPRLDWSAVVADLRELTALCERTKEDA